MLQPIRQGWTQGEPYFKALELIDWWHLTFEMVRAHHATSVELRIYSL